MSSGEAVLPEERARTLRRWLFTWTTIGIVLVLVVAGFLVGIVISLYSVNGNLAEASRAVTGIRGNVRTLPDAVHDINGALSRVDRALAPVPGQARTIAGRLGSIRRSLVFVEGSLRSTARPLGDTAGLLGGTSRSLVGTAGLLGDTASTLAATTDPLASVSGRLRSTAHPLGGTLRSLHGTSGALGRVRHLVRRIDAILVRAERPASLGSGGIYTRVAIANGALRPAEADARQILTQLRDIDRHLVSVCESPTVTTVGTLHGAKQCGPTAVAAR